MTTCGKCGISYGGAKTEHCMACHETFTGTRPGDMHRYGPPEQRQCRTPEEMRDKGMTQNVNDYWTTGKRMKPDQVVAFRQKDDFRWP